MRAARLVLLIVALGHAACGSTVVRVRIRYLVRPYPLPDGIGCLSWPTDNEHRRISAAFHDPNYFFKKKLGDHDAIDMPADVGTMIRASAAGMVVDVSPVVDKEHAAAVTIRFGTSWTYRVVHLRRIDVVMGQHVELGDVLGLTGGAKGAIGSGPYTTGPHLHFNVQYEGQSVDPEPYLCP